MVAEEAIMICIDNSRWMTFFDNRYSFKLQLNCVRSYCRAKFKCNPKNVIGILTIGTEDNDNLLEPTSDLDKILGHLKNGFRLGNGELYFSRGLRTSRMILERKYPSNQKRMLFFTGGPTDFNTLKHGKSIGEDLKQWGIAVDIVNFCLNERFAYYWIPGLEELIDAANENNNNNNKSHIKHHQPCIWTLAWDILPSIISGACSLEEEERRCLEANEPPNTNDEYDDSALERTVQLKEEYMALGLEDAAQCFAELENSVSKERKMERAKHDPREILLLYTEEEDTTTISKAPGVAAETGGKRKRKRKPKPKRKPQPELIDNKNILKTPPGVAAAERGGKHSPQVELVDNDNILKATGGVAERGGKHSLLMYVYSVFKTTHHNNIVILYISICICGCLLATYWLAMC
ncbi:uncharacterized protein [Rutidosis leptorrhynchoides]|uniref:uncharacterized protein n=1 Tax=Rutidosis leptorrhynchoides TaxID=125765 RepID=UPI003A994F8F